MLSNVGQNYLLECPTLPSKLLQFYEATFAGESQWNRGGRRQQAENQRSASQAESQRNVACRKILLCRWRTGGYWDWRGPPCHGGPPVSRTTNTQECTNTNIKSHKYTNIPVRWLGGTTAKKKAHYADRHQQQQQQQAWKANYTDF